jgi:hypothetical protein
MEENQQGVVLRHQVRLAEDAARVSVPGQPGKAEPQVHLIRDGNVVKAIEVVCACGQRLRLNCLYH